MGRTAPSGAAATSSLTFHLIPHTHWDREWYLPRAGFLARLVPAVGDLLDLLDREAGVRFVLDGQTVLPEDACAVEPDWRQRITAAVARGQLEVGPWYVLADELIPSGESLLRNLLHGARDAAALGRRMGVLYSPDAFGHPGALPLLADGFGIDAAVVWRGLAPDGADRDLYRWRAPSGADVLLYHLPAEGYEIGASLAGPARETAWRAIRPSLVARSATSHVAVFVGADHHAPPRDPAGMLAALRAIEPGHAVRFSTLREFFDAVAPARAQCPVVEGELRWSYGHTWTLQGIHATRARMKRRHGAAELALARRTEPLATLAAWRGASDRRGLLGATWRTLLQCQFHDTIGGCCSDDVAREQEVRLTSVHAMSDEIARASMHELAGHDADRARDVPGPPRLLLWNPAARRRGGLMTADITCFRSDILVGPPSGRIARSGHGATPFSLVTADGATVPVQVLSVRPGAERVDAPRHYPDQDAVDRVLIAFAAPPTTGLALSMLTRSDGATPIAPQQLHVEPGRIVNRYIEVQVGTDGEVTVIDRRSGEHYRDLFRFIDEPDLGDTYTPCIPGDATPRSAVRVLGHRPIATGPLVAALELDVEIACTRGHITGRLVLVVYADSPLLRVRIELDNRAIDHRTRIAMPIGAGTAAICGAAFGFERREPVGDAHGRFAAELPVRTAPAHRYVAAGAQDRGLAVFCPGFFEHEWTADRTLLLTLWRSVGRLSRDTLPNRPGHAGWPMATPEAQEIGHHVIEFAVAPLAEGDVDRPGLFEQWWEDLFLPLQPTWIRSFADIAPPMATGITLVGDGLVFAALKPAEHGDGIVLRCWNTAEVAVPGRWEFAHPISRATLLRADESVLGGLELAGRNAADFVAPARGIVTIAVTI